MSKKLLLKIKQTVCHLWATIPLKLTLKYNTRLFYIVSLRYFQYYTVYK